MTEYLPFIIMFGISGAIGFGGHALGKLLSKQNKFLVLVFPLLFSAISAYFLITVSMSTGGLELLGLVIFGILFGFAAIVNWILAIIFLVSKKRND